MNPILVCALCMAAPEYLTVGPVQTVAEGFQFTEGPVWLPTNKWVFSDIPADTIYSTDKTVFRMPSGKSNGLTLDNDGRLIACEHWNRRVTRTEKDGSTTVVADTYQGVKLNSPNDAVVRRSDGMIFFTDPPYGLEGREAELPFSGVFAVVPGGPLKLLARDFQKPNGLAFAPDEKVLYIADTDAKHIRAFDVGNDGSLSRDRILCQLPQPDGLKVDTRGYIWVCAGDGLRVYTPAGDRAGQIEFAQVPANCAFGGKDSKTLLVTARTAVYQITCAAPGLHPAARSTNR